MLATTKEMTTTELEMHLVFKERLDGILASLTDSDNVLRQTILWQGKADDQPLASMKLIDSWHEACRQVGAANATQYERFNNDAWFRKEVLDTYPHFIAKLKEMKLQIIWNDEGMYLST